MEGRRTKNKAALPEFRSPDEEKAYWEARGPLAPGHRGQVNRAKAGKRSSFLVVRLTGQELTKLRDLAAEHGLGPSTFARVALTSLIERQGKASSRVISWEQLTEAVEQTLPKTVKDRAAAFAREVAIGDPQQPSLLLIDAAQVNQFEDLARSLIMALLSIGGVMVIAPGDEKYEQVKEVVGQKA